MGQVPLPPQPHFPGQTERPSEAYFAPFKVGLGPDVSELAASAAFAAGLQAFAQRYYWEAHEFWEPVWMALPPNGAERLFLRGLIQLANAGLKARMGRDGAAVRVLKLADAAVAEAFHRASGPIFELTDSDVRVLRRQVIDDSASIMHYRA